ncbi:MAG TPA: alpha/beta hydrolase [Sulfurospirillum arcachonense]|nr:alpha/beta hydrolase [Sulfurospirillum arcachonense]HIP44642.1 alpha/beta hydrolase [Sulfurospirillum arcachonense]
MALRELVYNSQTYSISYEILNQNQSEVIVFLHGWGSNKEIMKQAFGKGLNNYKLIFLDLPGFGSSSVVIPIKTDDYAKIVKQFLETLHVKNFSVVGHSFGGKVGAILNPKNLILLSSAGILVEKSFKVKMKIRFFKLFKNIVPKSMYSLFSSDDISGMSQTMYEILKNVVDEDFIPIFKKVTSKTLIFWGKEDSATPLSSGKKISQIIKQSSFYPCEGDHFFFIKNSKFINKVINEQL